MAMRKPRSSYTATTAHHVQRRRVRPRSNPTRTRGPDYTGAIVVGVIGVAAVALVGGAIWLHAMNFGTILT